MTASLFLWALGLSVAYSLLPGPVAIESIHRGARGSRRAVVRVRLGALLGGLAWAALAFSGAGLVLQQSPMQVVVSTLGAALLLWMAWRALAPAPARACMGTPATTEKGDLLCGLGFALMNPLAGAFWLGMSGPIAQAAPAGGWLSGAAVFLGGYILGHLLFTAVLATAIAGGQRYCGQRLLHWATPVSGVALGCFGLQLLAHTLHLP
jgi:threonine/homoserine/homoserine lactone efflux protein